MDTLFSDYVSGAPAALRMTDNEILSSHSGERTHLQQQVLSSPNHASANQQALSNVSVLQLSSSRSISLKGDTPDSTRLDEETSNGEAKGHSADDEGKQ